MKKPTLFIISIIYTLCLCATLANAQTWQPNPKYIKSKDSAKTAGAKAQYQCMGTCKDGHRCNRKVKDQNAFCYQHQNQK